LILSRNHSMGLTVKWEMFFLSVLTIDSFIFSCRFVFVPWAGTISPMWWDKVSQALGQNLSN